MTIMQFSVITAILVIAVGHVLTIEEPISRVPKFTGTPIPVISHPTIVHVLYHDRRACDGTIISENFVLTAAHCIIGYWSKKVSVLVKDSQDQREIHNVTSMKYHKNYHPSLGTNDIALLKLKNCISLTEGVVFAKLPKNRIRFPSNDTQILSYRSIQPSEDEEQMLISASVDSIAPLQECAKYYNRSLQSLKRLFCAKSGKSKMIKEMTGGPVTFDGEQVGIVILERPLGLKPIMFIDVTRFTKWIDETKQNMTNNSQRGTSFHPLPKDFLDSNAKYRGEAVSDKISSSIVAIVDAATGKLNCLGNIVAPNLILTTDRCARKKWKFMRARSISRNNPKDFQERTFVRAFKRKDIDSLSLIHNTHDIALLQVERVFNSSVNSILKLGTANEGGIQPLTSGWMYGLIGGQDMRRVEALTIDHEECNWMYRKRGGVSQGTICALSYLGMCNHVAGEPLIIENRLVGILTATSENCADFRDPAIFVNLTNNFSWIQKKILRTSIPKERNGTA
ncbi:hypothetical protein QAD02_023884 [Eretmocerus hayati]|uniref:Uncharacterized protein n=1 Tax=Eretmocerus hayati TaxID=131215 RepID=A0ACC2PWV1_9HYME|nr:hypothetical protein QAD02_023884 [Eretmocerus hayati]